MEQDKKEKALKRVKFYQIAKQISLFFAGIVPSGCMILMYKRPYFVSINIMVILIIGSICFFVGLFLLFHWGFQKAMQAASTPKCGFSQQADRLKSPAIRSRKTKLTQKVPQALKETFGQNLSLREQGRIFAREINKANDLIPDKWITADLNIICNYVNDIYTQAAKDESIEQKIRKFNNIYLPKTLQLCNVYINLQKKTR
jgi:hypothetical protein